MKKFMIIASIVVIFLFVADYLFYYSGVLYVPAAGETACFSKAEGDHLYLDSGSGFEVFDIKGVNLGMGIPGHFATEKAIEKEDYLRWFEQIQAMGANVIRVYSLAGAPFYEAFYEYNVSNPSPLYLLHGVDVDEYLTNSIYSALDDEFVEPFQETCRTTVDVIHGRYKVDTDYELFPIWYKYDISPWVYGYILGTDWESTLICYTNYSFEQLPQMEGTYFYTEDASNFEIFLASSAEAMVSYEQEKYGAQRVMAFSNHAATDPLEYDKSITTYFAKTASLDVEHIKCTDAFTPGQFASYHVYPYYPDYYSFLSEHEENTYLQYLKALNDHHSVPVVISEFGIPSSRGVLVLKESGLNQGGISETQQGEALVAMYDDIAASGCSGAIVFSWQDEWFKHFWNTESSVNLKSTAYWSDYQTNTQYFGLLSFDPGDEKSICYVDGDRSDWTESDLVFDSNSIRLSMKYDEKFIYILVEKDGYTLGDELYIAIDTTPNSGSDYAQNFDLSMSDAADFIIELKGVENSRVWVQEYYNLLDALFYDKITPQNIFSKEFPAKDSDAFSPIHMLLQSTVYYRRTSSGDIRLSFEEYDELDPNLYQIAETFETGRLIYGNANPSLADFNSLADFCAGNGFVEIKLPWSLLNFSDPSQMLIHDDYYRCYGVEHLPINSLSIGAGDGSLTIEMADAALNPLGKQPTYHERLKASYYMLQNRWTDRIAEGD